MKFVTLIPPIITAKFPKKSLRLTRGCNFWRPLSRRISPRLEILGFDENTRQELYDAVNLKNKKRGYIDE